MLTIDLKERPSPADLLNLKFLVSARAPNDNVNVSVCNYTVVAHMLVTARKNYSMIYAYTVSFIECIDTQI